MDGCFSVRRKLNHSSFYPFLLPGASKPHMTWPLGLLWPLLLTFFPSSSLLLLWLQWPPDCSLNLPGLFPCQGFCTYFSLECIYSRYLQGLLPSPSGLCSNVTSLSHKAFPDHPISKCRYRHIPDCGRLWSKGGHNNIFYSTCSSATWPCHSSIKKWNLFSFSLSLNWPCDLLWPIDVAEVTLCTFLVGTLRDASWVWMLLYSIILYLTC